MLLFFYSFCRYVFKSNNRSRPVLPSSGRRRNCVLKTRRQQFNFVHFHLFYFPKLLFTRCCTTRFFIFISKFSFFYLLKLFLLKSRVRVSACGTFVLLLFPSFYSSVVGLHLLKALYKIFKMGDRKEGKMVQGEKSSFFREMTRNEWNFLPKKKFGKLSQKKTKQVSGGQWKGVVKKHKHRIRFFK